jgi:hypothetical protein
VARRWVLHVDEELGGTTFRVYLYVVKEGKPVGPRDVMRSVNLSSPSVAYRHLRKLETLGLLQKDSYGEYVVKEKANVRGQVWIGRSLVPRLVFYSFFFMGILCVEIAIIAIRLSTAKPIEADFIFLIFTTVVAMILFLLEGSKLLLRDRKGPNRKPERQA